MVSIITQCSALNLAIPKAQNSFYFHEGGIIIESDKCSQHECPVPEKRLRREFGEFRYAVNFYLAFEYESDSPEIWQKWWTNQMVGNNDDDDGPWAWGS